MVTICKGGHLLFETYDLVPKGKQSTQVHGLSLSEMRHREKDASRDLLSHWYDICDVEDGVIIRDVFFLVLANLSQIKKLVGPYAKQYCVEGINEPEVPNALESVRLKWEIEVFDKRNGFSGFRTPSFYGVADGQDIMLKDSPERDLNVRGYDIAHLPLRLVNEVTFIDYDCQCEPPETHFTLGEVIRGIFQTLTYKDRIKSSLCV